MLNNLTIVIITYKRYGYLKRQLDFYLSYKSKAKILVLDSTPYSHNDNELDVLLSHNNVEWKKYNEDIFFPEKIADGCEYIDTKYAVLSTDDDFLIPTSLDLCVDFLEKNSQYSSAQGLIFHHKSGNGLVKNSFRLDSLFSDEALSIEDKNGKKRLIKYMSGHSPFYPMYAVHASSLFSLIWKETARHTSSQGLPEVFSSCMSFIYGKMKVLPIFYCSREPNNFIGWDDKKTIKYVYSDKKISLAVTGLATHLELIDSISLENAVNLIQSSFKGYALGVLNKVDEQLVRNKHLFSPYFKKIREKVRIRSRFNSVFYGGCPQSIYKTNIEDFNKVKRTVLSFSLGFDELNEARKRIHYPPKITKHSNNK